MLVAISFVGCTKSKNAESIDDSVAIDPIEFSTKTLSFASFDEFRASVGDLIFMTEEDRQLWFKDKTDFTSQEQAASLVSQQLMKCRTYKQAAQLMDKYTQFVFNRESDEPDFTAYVPTNSLGYSMVCNAYGNVTIGGEVVNLNDVKTYDQTWQAGVERRHMESLTKGSSSTPNEVYCYTDNRKMWATAFRVTYHAVNGIPMENRLVLRLGAQQKICFIFCAWHEYDNEFSIMRNSYSYSGFTPGDAFLPLFANGQDVKVPGGVKVAAVGLINGTNVTANFMVYSQGVGYVNRGVLNINNPKNAQFYASNGQYVW